MKKLIGHAGVDSGQILICDPCYIDSEWTQEEFTDIRRYKHINGKVLEFRKDFNRFDEIVPDYGKCMNDMIEQKEATEMEQIPAENEFSYNACCKKTCGPAGMGQLNFRMGHAGVGVVVGDFGGDGLYPVYAELDGHGMVKSVTIKFD